MEAHGSSVENSFMAEIAERCMTVHDLDLLSNEDIP